MPIAVRDLDQSARDFAKLGFLIKPGRLHSDGISNRHIKFPNGSGIELITSASPTGELATEYAGWLKNGDGAAFWSLYSPDLGLLTATLDRLHLRPNNKGDIVTFSQTSLPHRLFFADRLRARNDGPVYWAHPNTAYKLQAIWIAGGSGERKLMMALGAQRREGGGCAPFDRHADVLLFPAEGDEVVFSKNLRGSAEREIAGATVRVRSLRTVRAILDANHVRYGAAPGCTSPAVWVNPADAHNVWLEFKDQF